MKNKTLFNYIKLILSISVIWAYFWVIHPILIQHMPNFAHYLDTAEKYDINPSALYYTDVPITTDGEMNSRDAVRFSNLDSKK